MYQNEPEWAKYITEESIEDYGLLDLISIIGFEATKKLMPEIPLQYQNLQIQNINISMF